MSTSSFVGLRTRIFFIFAACTALVALGLSGCTSMPEAVAEDYAVVQPDETGARLIPTLFMPYPLESGAISVFSAMCEAPDGSVYSGSCCYDDWAKVFRLQPGATALETVLDMGVLAGQRHHPNERHSKIHTQLTVGRDGWIYGGTKRGNEFFAERALYGASDVQYPGGIFFRQDPRTGLAQNLGIPRPGEGLISMAYDAERHRFWVLSDPRTELLRLDISEAGMRTTNLGQVSRFPARHFDVDAAGHVWIVSRDNTLLRVDAETHAMREFTISGLDHELPAGSFHFTILKPENRLLMMARGRSQLIHVPLATTGDAIRAEVLCDFVRLHPKLHSPNYTAIDPVTDRLFTFFTDGPWRPGRSVHLASAKLSTGEMRYHGQLAVVNGDAFAPSSVWAAVVTQSRDIVFAGANLIHGVHAYGAKDGSGVFRIGPIERILAASPQRELAPPPETAAAPAPRTPPEPKFTVLTLDDQVPFSERAVTGMVAAGETLIAACVGRDVVRLARMNPNSGALMELWRGALDPAFSPYAVELLDTPMAGRFVLLVRRAHVDLTAATELVNGWNVEAEQDEDGNWKGQRREPPDLTTFFGYPGGRVLIADVSDDTARVMDAGVPIAGEDLVGANVLNEALDLAAFTSWSGDFVHLTHLGDPATRGIKRIRVPAARKGQPDEAVTGLQAFNPLRLRHVSDAMLRRSDGQVLCSGARGELFLFDPTAGELRRLGLALPELPGREQFATLSGAVELPDGRVIGLTQAGRLFELDAAAERVHDLGKPLRQNGGKALVFNPVDGLIYGACGEAFGIDRIFSFDPNKRAYAQLGILNNPGETCRFGRVGAMSVLPDGRLAVGELDNLADIEIWPAASN